MTRHLTVTAIIIGFAHLSAATARSQQPPTSAASSADSAVIREVLASLHSSNEAFAQGDTAAVRQSVADDYLTINSTGRFGDKNGALSVAAGNRKRPVADAYTSTRVRVFGQTALITHVWHNPGQPDFAQTQIMTRRDGQWRVVGSQSTPIQARSPAPLSQGAMAVVGTRDSTLRQAIDERLQAEQRRDTAAFRHLTTPSFVQVDRQGGLARLDDRAAALASTPPRAQRAPRDEDTLYVYGSSAVRVSRSDQNGILMRQLELWVRDGPVWKVAAASATPILVTSLTK